MRGRTSGACETGVPCEASGSSEASKSSGSREPCVTAALQHSAFWTLLDNCHFRGERGIGNITAAAATLLQAPVAPVKPVSPVNPLAPV